MDLTAYPQSMSELGRGTGLCPIPSLVRSCAWEPRLPSCNGCLHLSRRLYNVRFVPIGNDVSLLCQRGCRIGGALRHSERPISILCRRWRGRDCNDAFRDQNVAFEVDSLQMRLQKLDPQQYVHGEPIRDDEVCAVRRVFKSYCERNDAR